MRRARGIAVIAFLFFLLAYAGLSSQEPPEFTAHVPFPPGVALTSPGGVDTLLVDPETIGVPLEVLVTDLLGAPVTNLAGDPIDVPVDFTIIKMPSGAAGAGFQPGGLDSVRVLTGFGGLAGVSFDVGDLPGVYQVEASSPYGDFNYVFTMLTTGFTTSITVVPHMPSAPVDTLGGIMVDIFPFDRSGAPMLDAELVVTLRQGPDGKWSYPVTNMGGGLYQAAVPSAIADAGVIIATDTASYAQGYAEVEYLKDIGDGLYFDTSDVQFMPVFEGEDQYYIVGAYLHDRFGNKFFEGEASYTGMVLGEPPIAIVDSTWFENDYFMSRIRSIDVGSCALTVDEWNFGVTDSVSLDFYAAALLDPEGTAVVGDTITVPLVIYLSDPADTLGFYDLDVSWNSEALELVSITDGDPNDAFDAPIVASVNDSTVSLMQSRGGLDMGETTRRSHVATVRLAAASAGPMRVDAPAVRSIRTKAGQEKPKAPVKPTKKKVKVKKVLNLKIFAEEGSGKTKESIKKEIAHAQAVFDKNYKSCCAITIKWDGVIDTFKTKEYDKDNDKKLKDYSDSKLTDEEKALIDKTKSKRKSDQVNVYYLKNNCTPKGSSVALGEAITKDDFGADNASVVMGPGAAGYGSKEKKGNDTMIKGLAHELAHILGELPDLAGAGTNKLMEYNSSGKSDSGITLSEEECKKIMDKGTANGWLKDS